MRETKTFTPAIRDVEVVPELCSNFRNCLRIAPGAFVRDMQTGRTRAAVWQQADPEALWKAAWSCPSGAIRFATDQGYVVPRWDEIAHWDTNRHRAAAAKPGQPLDKW